MLRVETRLPYLVVLNEDPLAADIVIYPLKEGYTFFGRDDCDPKPDVVVTGVGIDEKQCYFNHKVELDSTDNTLREIVMFHPISLNCFIEDEPVTDPRPLQHGDILRLGDDNYFRFNHPTEALRLRKLREASHDVSQSKSSFTPTSSKLRSEVARKEEELRSLQAKLEQEQLDKERVALEEKLSRERAEKLLHAEFQAKSVFYIMSLSNLTHIFRLARESELMKRALEEQAEQYKKQMQEQLAQTESDYRKQLEVAKQEKERQIRDQFEKREAERLQALREQAEQQLSLEVQLAIERERAAAVAQLKERETAHVQEIRLRDEALRAKEAQLQRRVADVCHTPCIHCRRAHAPFSSS